MLARVVLALAAPLPFSLTRRLFPWISAVFATPFLRRQIEDNLDHAYGATISDDEKRRIRRQVCRNVGLLVAEILALARRKLPAGYIRFDGMQRFDREIAPDRGILALTAHSGNWECLAWVLYQHWGKRAAAIVARRQNNQHLQRLVEEGRQRLGVETIYQDEPPQRVLRHLREGRVVATAPDQDIVRLAGIFLPFFGKPAYTPTGPAMLAYQTDAAIVVGIARRTPEGIVLDCPAPMFPNRDAPKAQEIERLTREWLARIEEHIRRHPADWMWFHRRWRTTPAKLAARRERRRARFRAQA